MSDSATTPANAALQHFCFFCFYFLTRQLEERKRMGEREKFRHLLSSVPTLFVPALVGCKKRKALGWL
jgi:hypothetical protein